jgi:hypothetical protein
MLHCAAPSLPSGCAPATPPPTPLSPRLLRQRRRRERQLLRQAAITPPPAPLSPRVLRQRRRRERQGHRQHLTTQSSTLRPCPSSVGRPSATVAFNDSVLTTPPSRPAPFDSGASVPLPLQQSALTTRPPSMIRNATTPPPASLSPRLLCQRRRRERQRRRQHQQERDGSVGTQPRTCDFISFHTGFVTLTGLRYVGDSILPIARPAPLSPRVLRQRRRRERQGHRQHLTTQSSTPRPCPSSVGRPSATVAFNDSVLTTPPSRPAPFDSGASVPLPLQQSASTTCPPSMIRNATTPPPASLSPRLLCQRRRRERQRQHQHRQECDGSVGTQPRTCDFISFHTGFVTLTGLRYVGDSILPIARRSHLTSVQPLTFGRMDAVCHVCGAKHWCAERVEGTIASPTFSHCCHGGKVILPPIPQAPSPLRELLEDQSSTARHFRQHIRQYNCAFAFTSFRANNEDVNLDGRGPWTWKTGYQIYHTVGTLCPVNGAQPSYTQLYFYDPADALNHRKRRNPNLRGQILHTIQQALHHSNPFCQLFLNARDVLRRETVGSLAIRIINNPETDQRRYNAPTVDELAVLVIGNDQDVTEGRDIILRPRHGGLQRISDLHSAYAPLHYVLLFPMGTSGWNTNLTLHPPNAKRMSQVQFYSYRLHLRDNDYPSIHLGGRLFQQYVCDMWVSTDHNRLRWVQQNQPRLRAALYSGLEDVASQQDDNVDLHTVGRRVVLPSSYIGGPRYMNQRFQDAIAVARHYHGFDLFITFTSNPSWEVLTSALLPGQTTADRPDLIVRVFKMYKDALLHDVVNGHIFGHILARVHSIEFQKRGLPHMHLLLSLFPRDRPQSPADVDGMIRASWPDPEQEPVLFDIVKRCMVHGPCGPGFPHAPCMRDGKCSKGFPKPFQAVTVMTRDGYPTYARPADGRSFEIGGFVADNRWIVPYNPYLLMRYAFFPSRFPLERHPLYVVTTPTLTWNV